MKINAVIAALESAAHPSLQEHYDNAGLITGSPAWDCTGILCTLDATAEVVQEAIDRKVNLIVTHHPIVFGGLKKINGKNYVEKAVISAIKNDIAIYAIHTNLDNVIAGVNGKIASLLGLTGTAILLPKDNTLRKLFTFVPATHAEAVRNAIFNAGGGQIGNYSECSFNAEGTGTFKAGEGTNPFVGEKGLRHEENEIKIEVVFPAFAEQAITRELKAAHPYEEVAFDIISLVNPNPGIGSGLVGSLPEPMDETSFLGLLRTVFGTPVIRHTALRGGAIQRVAVCGGAGSFLISKALSAGADAYITADLKYHEFFDANDRMLLCDIGHFESEQYTIDLLKDFLEQKFPTFAVLKTRVITNPVRYYK